MNAHTDKLAAGNIHQFITLNVHFLPTLATVDVQL